MSCRGPVSLNDHPVRLPPLRRSKTTDHGHGRVVRPFLAPFHEGEPPRCWASPAHFGSMQQCPWEPVGGSATPGECERRTDHAAGRAFAYSKSSGGCAGTTGFREKLSHHLLDLCSSSTGCSQPVPALSPPSGRQSSRPVVIRVGGGVAGGAYIGGGRRVSPPDVRGVVACGWMWGMPGGGSVRS